MWPRSPSPVGNPVRGAVRWVARQLARRGVVDAERGERTADLAWPRMLTGLARMSQQVVDFAMIGTVLGPPALAGLAFAFAYWQIGNTLSLGVSGGTISLISQRYGAGRHDEIDLVIKASVAVALVLALPLTLAFWTVPAELVGVLGDDPATVAFGATYLAIVGLGLPFEFLNKVASRALVGADDARTPMLIRATGAALNIVLNVLFIFGLGLGVAGAALGTLVATLVVTAALGWGFVAGRLPGIGAFPIGVRLGPPYVDVGLLRRLLSVASPLMGRWLATTLAVFPLLAVVATFGPVVVAAFEVSRRVRQLLVTPNWGFSLAASSLVGQQLGGGDEAEAAAYGWDILWFSLVVHGALAAIVVGFARPIAGVFVDDPVAVARAVPFIRVAAVSVLGLGIDGVATGTLRGSGDTRWPFYGKLLGLYAVTLPVAYLGVVTPLGVAALYAALLAETAVPAAVSLYRFRSGRWLAVSRAYRSAAD